MTKNNSFSIAALGLLILVVILGSFLMNQKSDANPSPYPLAEEEMDIATPSPVIQSTPDTSMLRAGGSSYRDTKGVYAFLYPNDYALDGDDMYKRISKRGDQTRPQGEITDGVLVVFESVDLQGKSLETWVDDRIAESTGQGTAELIEAKKAVTINGYPGFTYETRGFGSAVTVVLQKNADSKHAVNIAYSVSDPNNKNYQSEVDAVLSTLELLK